MFGEMNQRIRIPGSITRPYTVNAEIYSERSAWWEAKVCPEATGMCSLAIDNLKFSTVVEHGVLKNDVNLKLAGKKPIEGLSGARLFREMMDWIEGNGAEIDVYRSVWIQGNDNYRTYEERVAHLNEIFAELRDGKHRVDSPHFYDAVWATWSGKQARAHGFNTITEITLDKDSRALHQIRVDFVRGS